MKIRTIAVALFLVTIAAAVGRFAFGQPAQPAMTRDQGPSNRAAPSPPEPWVDEAEGCRLYARMTGNSFRAGEQVIVEVEVQCVGKESRRFVVGEDVYWHVRATDQLGNEVEPTRYGRYLAGGIPNSPRSGMFHGLSISPGHSVSQVLVLNRFCDLTVEGTYTVTIGREMEEDGRAVILKAVPLKVEIDGGPPSLSSALQTLALQRAHAGAEAAFPPEGLTPGEHLAELRAEERQQTLRSIGEGLKGGIAALMDAAVKDQSKDVKKTARGILADLSAQAGAAVPEQYGPVVPK